MCMWNKDRSALLSLVIVRACYVLLAVCCVIAPWLVRYYDEIVNEANGMPSVFVPLLVTLYCAVPAAAVALVCLDKLLGNVRRDEPFVQSSVKYLRIISWCCFAESAVFVYLAFIKQFAFLIIIGFAFIGLILRVVKNVFEQAIVIREENDYTI